MVRHKVDDELERKEVEEIADMHMTIDIPRIFYSKLPLSNGPAYGILQPHPLDANRSNGSHSQPTRSTLSARDTALGKEKFHHKEADVEEHVRAAPMRWWYTAYTILTVTSLLW